MLTMVISLLEVDGSGVLTVATLLHLGWTERSSEPLTWLTGPRADHAGSCQPRRQDGDGPVSGRSAMVHAMSGSPIAASGPRKACKDKIVLDGVDLDVRRGSRAGA
ncbi:hypothetical protein [Nonomuraea dietziae]|uniref:hypothetical protein n=1 Tax=Nonomuraea dietziae TaxID=65515 RepID=UPI003431793B